MFPGNTEVPDGVDNHCDGRVDEGCSDEGLAIPDVGGCGCATGANLGGALAGLAAALVVRRRRTTPRG